MGKRSRNGKKLALNVGCHFENLKPYQNQICIQSHHVLEDRGIQARHHHLLWKGKICHITKQDLKTQMLDIAKVVTSCLNPMVMACVMNQSHGHWLLFDALKTTMILVIKVQIEMVYVATLLWPSVGVKPNTWKKLALESSGTPENSEDDLEDQNTSHWGVLSVIGKFLKRRYRKCPRILDLDVCNSSYGQKKGRESNWQFDS